LPNDVIGQGELSSILHAIFFAYEQQSRSLLNGDEDVVLASMVSDFLARDLTGINDRLKGKTVEQKLHSFARLLVKSKLVGQANVVKHGSDYEFSVEACTLASTMRRHKNGMTLACPWGIVASSIASRTSGKNFHPTRSIATDLGASTRILFQENSP